MFRFRGPGPMISSSSTGTAREGTKNLANSVKEEVETKLNRKLEKYEAVKVCEVIQAMKGYKIYTIKILIDGDEYIHVTIKELFHKVNEEPPKPIITDIQTNKKLDDPIPKPE